MQKVGSGVELHAVVGVTGADGEVSEREGVTKKKKEEEDRRRRRAML